MKRLCKTCKFSRMVVYDKDYITRKIMLKCDNKNFVESEINDITEEEELKMIKGLEYFDAECFHAEFCVGPEFGCIHWEERMEE